MAGGTKVNAVERILTSSVCNDIRAPIEHARTLPREAFTDAEFFDAEIEHVFSANWCALDFVELVAVPGKIKPVNLGGIPLLITCSDDGRPRVFHNIVPYDGCLAVMAEADHQKAIRAPYHGWRYSLEGQLLAIPYWDGTPDGSNLDELGDRPGNLIEVASAVFGPILFVNLSGTAESFETASRELRNMFDDWDLNHLQISASADGSPLLFPEALSTNWKTHLENWGINVLHEAFVHDLYDASPEVPRMTEDGQLTFEHFIDGPMMALKYVESDFPLTYGDIPFPHLSANTDKPPQHGYFGTFMPNLHFGVFSNLIHFIIALPDSAGETRTCRAQFLHPAAATDPDLVDARLVIAEGFVAAGIEDAQITEAIQQARRSPVYTRQYFSARWDVMHHAFTRWVVAQFPILV